MSKRVVIDPFKAKIVEDETKKAEEAAKKAASSGLLNSELEDLDSILKAQLLGLGRLTSYIVKAISLGDVTKDTAHQLATCIKVTMDLKNKERELLENMSDEDLQKLVEKDENL